MLDRLTPEAKDKLNDVTEAFAVLILGLACEQIRRRGGNPESDPITAGDVSKAGQLAADVIERGIGE